MARLPIWGTEVLVILRIRLVALSVSPAWATLVRLTMLEDLCTFVALTSSRVSLVTRTDLLIALCAALVTPSITVWLHFSRAPNRSDPFIPGGLVTVAWTFLCSRCLFLVASRRVVSPLLTSWRCVRRLEVALGETLLLGKLTQVLTRVSIRIRPLPSLLIRVLTFLLSRARVVPRVRLSLVETILTMVLVRARLTCLPRKVSPANLFGLVGEVLYRQRCPSRWLAISTLLR